MIDWDALSRDYPTFRHWESQRRQWQIMWRYDPERVALARSIATLERAKKRLVMPLINWLGRRFR